MNLCNRFIAAHALGFSWSSILHCTNWLVNGMPERFPKLKTIWVESGLAWIPFLMQRLDNEWMMRSSEVPLLKKRPSDYMREMYYSSQPMEMVDNRAALELTFKMINAETQLCYSSDYPHWDTDLPATIYDLSFLPEEAKRNILGGNALKLFKLEPRVAEWKEKRRAARAAE
jgi:predicted TIM-barrel fold metal-dependent hydrolase